MMLSVLFTTALSTMCGVTQAHLSTWGFEVGGFTATTNVFLSLSSPRTKSRTTTRRTSALATSRRPLRGTDRANCGFIRGPNPRAVVLEREVEETLLWEGLVNGWEDAGYNVTYDFTEEGHQYVRVIQARGENYIHTVYVGDNESREELLPAELEPQEAEPEAPLPRGARAISFPDSVPETIASSLRRLHQNLGHPSTADFVRHLRLAGASREVLKGARSLECQSLPKDEEPSDSQARQDRTVLPV